MNLEFILILMFCLTAIDFVKLERRNVALNKTVTASSVFDGNDYWLRKENIVDGGLVRKGEACQCCFATQHSTNPWITIDLEQEFAVDLVTVYGRTDHKPPEQNMQGLQLHVVKASDVQDDGVFTVTSEDFVNFADISLKEAEKARYITLVLPGKKILALCEVKVYKAECVPGTYDNACSQTCGECSDGEICDIDNGECQSCKPGFQGPKCQQACDPGTYGKECIMSCGNCDANQPCDPITGECDKCATGYKGTNCLSECEAGTYGENCSAICGPCKNYDACHHITGFCKSGCIPGRLGDFCKQESMEDGGSEVVSLSIFIAVVAILVCVILIFAATLLVFLRKWNNRPPIVQSTVTKETTSVTMETSAVTNETDEHTYDDLH